MFIYFAEELLRKLGYPKYSQDQCFSTGGLQPKKGSQSCWLPWSPARLHQFRTTVLNPPKKEQNKTKNIAHLALCFHPPILPNLKSDWTNLSATFKVGQSASSTSLLPSLLFLQWGNVLPCLAAPNPGAANVTRPRKVTLRSWGR